MQMLTEEEIETGFPDNARKHFQQHKIVHVHLECMVTVGGWLTFTT
jgi:hypothetical protein